MPKTKTLEYGDDEIDVTIIVCAATIKTGMRRAVLSEEGKAITDEVDHAMRIIATTTWPAICAATVSVDGLEWPMTLQQFCELPDALGNRWLDAVYELNRHWFPSMAGSDEVEALKKGRTTSTSG